MHTHTQSNQLQYPSSTSSTSSPTSSSTSSRPPNPHPEDSSAEDEEEVVFDLDEAAMAQLPLHLQQTMREIQRERVRRLSQRPGNAMATKMAMGMGMRAPVSNDTYADRWVKNMMARVSNDQAMSVARGAGGMDMDMALNIEGNPFDRVLEADPGAGGYEPGLDAGTGEHSVSASARRYYSYSRSMSMSMSGRNVFLGCVGSFERNTLTRCTSDRRVCAVFGDKFPNDHVSEVSVLAEEKMQQRKTGQFRRTMSAVRVRMKKSFQKMSMMLRK